MTAAQYEMMRYKVPSVPQEVLWLRMFNLNLTKILEVTVSYQENTREREQPSRNVGRPPRLQAGALQKISVVFLKCACVLGKGGVF